MAVQCGIQLLSPDACGRVCIAGGVPPGIEWRDGQLALMFGDSIAMFDALCCLGGNRMPFEIIVYDVVADAEFVFIKLSRLGIKKVGGRWLGVDALIRSEIVQ